MTTSTDQDPSDAEQAITASIRKRVTADQSISASGKNVTITTIGTRVTLRGQVKSEQERKTLVKYAKQGKNVTDVDDQLTVK